MKTSNLDFETLIQGFKLSCQTEGKSPKTVEWYTDFLRRFLRFLRLRNLPCDLDGITRDHIRGFIRFLQVEARTPRSDKPLSPAIVQGYVRTLKAFFSWAAREGYLDANLMRRISVPKAPVKIVNTLELDQIHRLMDMCLRANGNSQRNQIIILMLLDSGLRVSELVNIEIEDVNLPEGHVKIRHAKGARERFVPIGSVVQKHLWKYINLHRRPMTDRITRLFLSETGLPLTRSGIQQMLRRCGKKAGINGVRCSPHTFRHTFAKRYLLNGGDIFSLQRILGHSSLASVRVYLNLVAADVKKQHRRFSPVDNMAENRNLKLNNR